MTKLFDVAIIGGGINGCGCAADAALRGLSVVLCEKQDLASQTSSSSSKLIHGGLRYLEQFDFNLVQKSLNERQILLKIAPHLVHPLCFIIPQKNKQRPQWILRLGLFLYDNLSRRNTLPASKPLTRNRNTRYFNPLISSIQQGFKYYDCRTDDARLTITNALHAKQHGARILTQTEVIHAEVIDSIWHLTVQTPHHDPRVIKARSLINAAGPWVESLNHVLNIPNDHTLSLVKGSHIVIEKLYEGDYAYVLQHDDKRIVFTIPYFGYTLVGTTDVPFAGEPSILKISDAEIDYLFDLIDRYFGKKIEKKQIITSWSGVRPLLSTPHKNASTLSRDYLYSVAKEPAPCVVVYGGKLTTYRILAEKVVDQLRTVFPTMAHSSTHKTILPGSQSFSDYPHHVRQSYPWLDAVVLKYYLETYGTRAENILQGCASASDLGIHFENTLYQREVDYLINEEWATSVDDILWRRTKLGLNFTQKGCDRLEEYVTGKS